MPKKTRKMKQRSAMRRGVGVTPQVETAEEGAVEAKPMLAARPIPAASRPATPLTFDYSYIYGDLRRIAMFAGFFFIVLLVLSQVIK